MAEMFLYLEVSHESVTADVCGISGKKVVNCDTQTVNFRDLPGREDGESDFEAVMGRLSSEMDLSSCKEAFILLNTSWFFFRNIVLPFKSKSKIKQVLPLELEPTFPVENEDYLTDFLLSQSASDTGITSVCCASIPEQDFQTYHDCLMKYQIRPAVITPSGVASAAWFLNECRSEEDLLFLDISEDEATISLIVDSRIFAVRSFSVACLTPDFFSDELNRMILGFWQVNGFEKSFDIIVVSREDEDALEEFSDCLKRTLNFQASYNQAAEKKLSIKYIDRTDIFLRVLTGHENGHLFNLCQGKYGSQSFIKANFSKILVSCSLLCLIFMVFMVQVFSQVSVLEKKVAMKQQEKAAIFKKSFPDKKLGKIDPLQYMKSLVKEMKNKSSDSKNHDGLPGQRSVRAVQVITELSRLIPQTVDVELSRLMLDSEKVIITGSTLNFNMVDQIKGFIEKSAVFEKVEISSATASQRTKRIDFKFIIEVGL